MVHEVKCEFFMTLQDVDLLLLETTIPQKHQLVRIPVIGQCCVSQY